MAYNQGGNLIEYSTCIHASHAECSHNMPINFADRRVVWRCTACEEEDGKTQCLYSKYKNRVQKKNNKQQQRTRQNMQRQKKEKITGRVEEVPKFVTRFIETDL
jgi:hypothetical protein